VRINPGKSQSSLAAGADAGGGAAVGPGPTAGNLWRSGDGRTFIRYAPFMSAFAVIVIHAFMHPSLCTLTQRTSDASFGSLLLCW
jgi:hypothetical protein